MGYAMVESPKSGHGNLNTLTKVDKLRELIGSRVSLPQVVVVGDQSSGKSSVLEGITGFAFPRAAELCTRYCTQITCRREQQRSIAISIIPHEDADPQERAKMKEFNETLDEITNERLAEIFKKANETMGLRSSASTGNPAETYRSAFSENILKIEICGPDQDHFTVIDVPGIFRRETEGLTTEDDIDLVRKMVKNCMKNDRTIILAIIPSNVDPATQEILKLAKQVDPNMTRTMGVLTKPDLNIERTTQQIAIDHVNGKRSDLTLGYYIVKNRGPDDINKTLKDGQNDEVNFFAHEPWSVLRNTGRAGIDALKNRVRELLTELIKNEFPKLKLEVTEELSALRNQRDEMGVSRSSTHSQRIYLGTLCERFQSITRDALSANYTGNAALFDRQSLRLITQIVDANDKFSTSMSVEGHTRPFSRDSTPETAEEIEVPEDEEKSNTDEDNSAAGSASHIFFPVGKSATKTDQSLSTDSMCGNAEDYPELENILDFSRESCDVPSEGDEIMDYIESVYNDSRGLDLGTFGGSLLATIFKEQSRKWEPLTLAYVSRSILLVHRFIDQALREVCSDQDVRRELWNDHLLEELQKAYTRAMDHAKFLLSVERQGRPYTLNHYFNDNLQQSQSGRWVALMKTMGNVDASGTYLTWKQLRNISANKANSEQVREYIHDVLKSYYKVARKRFVDVVFQQAVDHHLLIGEKSPLRIFTSDFVMGLSEDQLDMIAGESASVKAQRVKLERDIGDFEEAMKVLKGSR